MAPIRAPHAHWAHIKMTHLASAMQWNNSIQCNSTHDAVCGCENENSQELSPTATVTVHVFSFLSILDVFF